MPQYLLAVHTDYDATPPPADEMEKTFRTVDELNAEMQRAGIWVFGGGLLPPSSTTVVRVTDRETVITDGPFAETKEQLGGFWIIKVPDLDAALDWSTRAAAACKNPVEVRPFEAMPEA